MTLGFRHTLFPSHTVCRFETAKKKGEYDDESRRRENAKASLERYMHYFERYDAHSKAREKVRAGRGVRVGWGPMQGAGVAGLGAAAAWELALQGGAPQGPAEAKGCGQGC